ncbi:hypothetical protein ACFVIM_06000 [Streptomyces sp. NPDC057638]|uniref:hypothetical protein n=1 Tax=Streptomyces sp. NPDC057638 TaxID=3346190 RepID=UPI003684CB14
MDRPLLSLRATLVLLLTVLAGLGAGVLAGLAGEGAARSALCALAAAGAAVPLFNGLVAVERPEPGCRASRTGDAEGGDGHA